MSLPRYPKYKDSGVEWLGQVPEGWAVMPLKRDLSFLTSGSRGWADNYAEEGELFIRITNLTRDGIGLDLSDVQRVNVPDGAEGSRTKVHPGDVLFSITAYLGSVAVVPDNTESAYVSQHVALARLRRIHLSPKWAGYASISVIGKTWFDRQSYGGTKIQLSLDDIRELPLPVPPLPEQLAIVTFLDRETAKIDALMAEQQRLIDLLKEKRQAAISHAVTKGLNPDAPMKDSGVEWLGEVPTHWEVKRLKFALSSTKAGPFGSALTKDMYVESGFRVYGQEQVIPGDFSVGDYYIAPDRFAELCQYSVSPGDILVSCVGTFGKIAIVPDGIEPGIINPRLMRLRCSPGVFDQYIVDVLRSSVTFEQFSATSRGGTMDVINIGTLSEIWIALPPTHDQQAIHGYLMAEIARLDALTAAAESAIALLRERRAALISAAVTGQVDVRHLGASESA